MALEIAEMVLALIVAIPLSVLIAGMAWFIIRMFRIVVPVEEVEQAYKYKRLRTEIEKRGIDFKEMMQEFYEALPSYKYKKIGILNKVDRAVDGELEDEPEKKGKAK